MEHKQILSLLVHNHPGVLIRIAGLFSRRGFNIDSLTVSETPDKEYSRMTIVVRGDDGVAEQVLYQALKVADVKVARLLPEQEAILSELMLIKVRALSAERSAIHKIAFTYHATVVNIGQTSMTIQATGHPSELDALTEHLQKQGILELVRTGLTALEAGDPCLVDHPEE